MIQIEYNTTGSVWYAMKASYGKALKAKELLDSMAIESYLPMCYKSERVNGRNKIVAVPAVPNLIFVKGSLADIITAKLKINYLHNMLSKRERGDNILEPIIVPEIEMVRFMRVVDDAKERIKFVDPEINRMEISKGAKVRVISGDFEGYEGVLCRPKGSRAKKVLISVCGLAPVEMPIIDIKLLEIID